MWRNIASNAVTFILVGLFLLGGVILWGRSQYDSPGPLTEAICLQVDRGSTMRRVSEDLAAEGAVSSSAIFRIGAEYEDKNEQLKAGSFLVPPETSMQEIVDIVTRGGASTCGTEIVYRVGVNNISVQVRELDPATNRFVERAEFTPGEDDVPAVFTEKRAQDDTRYRIAMAEGVTSWQVTEALKGMDFLEGEVENVPAEGSLAPDSYELRAGDDRSAVLAQMGEAQQRLLADAWDARASDLPIETPEELLVLASIIEKETGVPEERGQVASVFVNRLNPSKLRITD